MDSNRHRRGPRIPDVWFVGAGIVWLLWATVQLIQTTGWKSVPGSVTYTRVDTTYASDTSVQTTRRIAYEYTVGDTTYVGDKIWRGLGDFGMPLPLLRQYTPSQSVRVHYDPDNPQRAVLSRGYSPGEALVLGIIGLIGFLKLRRRASLVPP